MGLVVAVVLLLVVGAGVAGWLAVSLAAAESKGRAKAADNADEILDATFDGSATVTYDSRVYNHLNAATVVRGGIARGYTLAHDAGGDLTFTKDA